MIIDVKFFTFALMSLIFFSCTQLDRDTKSIENREQYPEIPEVEVDKTLLFYNNDNSLWSLDDKLYSGYAVTYFPDSSLAEKFALLDGRKQNQESQWFLDGHLKWIRNFNVGKLHGEAKTWAPDADHTLISHLNYYEGKLHGLQMKWYDSGELFKKLNLNMGREEGMQQAFRKNGDLYANYEARNGRTYGLKKAALCFGIEDEQIQYEN